MASAAGQVGHNPDSEATHPSRHRRCRRRDELEHSRFDENLSRSVKLFTGSWRKVGPVCSTSHPNNA